MQLYFVCTFWHELILNNINPPNFYPQVPPITLQSTHHISLDTWKLQSNETVTKKKLSKLFTRYRLKTYAPYTRKHTSAKITQTLSAQFKNYCWLWFKCSLKMYLFTGIVILIETPLIFSLPFDFYSSIQFIIMIFIRTKISQSVSNYSSKSDNTWSKELCYLLLAVLSEFKTLFPNQPFFV